MMGTASAISLVSKESFGGLRANTTVVGDGGTGCVEWVPCGVEGDNGLGGIEGWSGLE